MKHVAPWPRRRCAVVLIGEETLQYRDHVHNELRLAWTNRTNWVCQMPSGLMPSIIVDLPNENGDFQ
jgi:hypothetical protein